MWETALPTDFASQKYVLNKIVKIESSILKNKKFVNMKNFTLRKKKIARFETVLAKLFD